MRHHTFFISLCSAIICANIFSCKESTSPINVENSEPLHLRNAFFPLAIANSWTYIDSLFTAADTTNTSYTISIVSVRTDTVGTWWKFKTNSASAGSFHSDLMERNDSVYSLQHNFEFPVSSLEYIPPQSAD